MAVDLASSEATAVPMSPVPEGVDGFKTSRSAVCCAGPCHGWTLKPPTKSATRLSPPLGAVISVMKRHGGDLHQVLDPAAAKVLSLGRWPVAGRHRALDRAGRDRLGRVLRASPQDAEAYRRGLHWRPPDCSPAVAIRGRAPEMGTPSRRGWRNAAGDGMGRSREHRDSAAGGPGRRRLRCHAQLHRSLACVPEPSGRLRSLRRRGRPFRRCRRAVLNFDRTSSASATDRSRSPRSIRFRRVLRCSLNVALSRAAISLRRFATARTASLTNAASSTDRSAHGGAATRCRACLEIRSRSSSSSRRAPRAATSSTISRCRASARETHWSTASHPSKLDTPAKSRECSSVTASGYASRYPLDTISRSRSPVMRSRGCAPADGARHLCKARRNNPTGSSLRSTCPLA